MSGIKKIMAAALILAILSVCAAGMAWHTKNYIIIDLKVYPRDALVLDLRNEEVSIAHYKKILRKLPQCKVAWNIPLQGSAYPHDSQMLRLETLSEDDLEALTCFSDLKTVDASGCTDYAQLQLLQNACPDVDVIYTVTLGNREYDQKAQTVYVDGITEREVAYLAYLPELNRVCIESGKDPVQLSNLVSFCRDRGIPISLRLGGRYYTDSAVSLTLSEITQEELPLLEYLPGLDSVFLKEPQVQAKSLYALMDALPDVKITWAKEILGIAFSSKAEVIDLSEAISEAGAAAVAQAETAPIYGTRDEETYLFSLKNKDPLPDMTAQTNRLIAQVEEALEYFPDVQKILMCGSILDNEAMAAFREDHRDDYQVVWTVQCGQMAARTDTPYFMPTKYHVYYFHDDDAANLRYCEDIICVDLGHMTIQSIEWVEHMPNLQYLVLAHTDVRSIEPIRSCKKLKFLELDWSAVPDYSPLIECTALEDLNLGNTNRDFTPIGEMTWLKNLWMVGCNNAAAYRMTQALPNTKIMATGSATVANGWRELPNYYAMRDVMNMHYMQW